MMDDKSSILQRLINIQQHSDKLVIRNLSLGQVYFGTQRCMGHMDGCMGHTKRGNTMPSSGMGIGIKWHTSLRNQIYNQFSDLHTKYILLGYELIIVFILIW